MHKIEVGTLYSPTRRQWQETPQLRMQAAGVELALFYASPTPTEVEAVRHGKAQFAWIDSEHTGMLAFRLGDGVRWSDCPYHPHREQAADPDARVGIPDEWVSTLLTVVLVDAATGITRAILAVSWPERFTRAVRASVRRMLEQPYSDQAHNAAIDNLYARYPTTAKLVHDRADVTCTGGTAEAAAGTGPDASPEPE